MNPADVVPIVLLLLFGAALGMSGVVVLLAIRWNRHQKSIVTRPVSATLSMCSNRSFLLRPIRWLAVRGGDPAKVHRALSLAHATLSSQSDEQSDEQQFLIAPSIRGWVLVLGAGLPDPVEDVDANFRFLCELSHKLGEVQFFCADSMQKHHAWVRMEAGSVIRAYAWGGETLWNQGSRTSAETALDLKALDYEEEAAIPWGMPDFLALNVEKIPQLAARWSLDPAEVATCFPAHAVGFGGRPPAS